MTEGTLQITKIYNITYVYASSSSARAHQVSAEAGPHQYNAAESRLTYASDKSNKAVSSVIAFLSSNRDCEDIYQWNRQQFPPFLLCYSKMYLFPTKQVIFHIYQYNNKFIDFSLLHKIIGERCINACNTEHNKTLKLRKKKGLK